MELLGIAQELDVLKRFAQRRCRKVDVRYIPGMPYQVGFLGDDPKNEPHPLPEPYDLTFYLEDSMFGGEVFAAVTCNGLVVVRPFLWPGYDALLKMRITVD